jgi:ATP-binding cassette subfamily B multidrug efflux pump
MLPKSLRPLYPYLKRNRRGFLVSALCVLLLNGIAVQSPQVILRALDYLKNGGRSERQLVLYALLLVAIALGKGIFQFLTRWIVIGISRDIEFDLRNDMFRHLESLSFTKYLSHINN